MDFVALDLETANKNPDSVCELGLVRFEGDVEVVSWSSTIRPARSWELEPINFSKHGITQEEILSAPTLADVWSELSGLLAGLPLVAHGATQDLNKLLESARVALGESWSFPSTEYFCSLVLAKRTESLKLDSYSLRNLALEFGISSPDVERSGLLVHSAETDARACGLVSLALMERNRVRSLAEMAKKLGVKAGLIENQKVIRRSVSKTQNSFFGSPTPNAAEYSLLRQELEDSGWWFEGHNLAGKSFVLTLSLESLTETEFVLACAMVGAEVKSGVSSKLDYLVEGFSESGKYQQGETTKSKKAREINQISRTPISIIEEAEFLSLLGTEVIEAVKELSQKQVTAKKAEKLQISEEDLQLKEQKWELEQQKREVAEIELKKFLRNPSWSNKQLLPGQKVSFTQIMDWELEERLSNRCTELGFVVTKSITKDLDLLVVEDAHSHESAKLRDSLRKGLDVTLLSTFLKSNPEVAVATGKPRRGLFGFFG